jgi:hypothetical protein
MPGIILLAGWTMDYLLSHAQRKYVFIYAFIFIFGFSHQLWQTWQLNYRYQCDPVNPYVYAHTGKDIELINQTMNQLAAAAGHDLRIDVIFSGHDYWPLPWYLRSFKYTGWWETLDFQNPPAPVILLSADQQDNLLKKLYDLTPAGKRELYLPLFERDIELRPGLVMRGFINYDTWQKLKPSPQPAGIRP